MVHQLFLSRKLIPDFIFRIFLRIFLKIQFGREPKDVSELQDYINNFILQMNESPISIETDVVNEQHYEVPPDFFKLVLGKHLKYSCGMWKRKVKRKDLLPLLDQSEKEMIELTIKRAGIMDGNKVMDLGCGWGSLSLYLAEKYPNCLITAISNSKDQKEYIHAEIQKRNIKNLTVIKDDVKKFQTNHKYDQIISVEMFEHMRNYKLLLKKLSSFLTRDGKLFIHIFTDDNYPYFFESGGRASWMKTFFFQGGMMPSSDLLFHFTEDFVIQKIWKVNGTHYKNTLNAWLKKFDKHRKKIKKIFRNHYGRKQVLRRKNYWRLFFLILSEVFGYDSGNKRYVTHYLLKKR